MPPTRDTSAPSPTNMQEEKEQRTFTQTLMRTSQTTIPPRIRGSDRGQLVITVDEVVYFPNSQEYSQRRVPTTLDVGTTLIRLRWWGEKGEGTVWRPSTARMDMDGNVQHTTMSQSQKTRLTSNTAVQELEIAEKSQSPSVIFPIMVSLNTLTDYLNDCQWLVFEIYHFLENDPAAIHREFIKQLRRAAHPNRAHPQVKPPLGHIMFDLTPLRESLSFGDYEWSGAKNLPIIVNGVPIGQVSVRVSSILSAAPGIGDVPRPEAEVPRFVEPQRIAVPITGALPPQQQDPFATSQGIGQMSRSQSGVPSSPSPMAHTLHLPTTNVSYHPTPLHAPTPAMSHSGSRSNLPGRLAGDPLDMRNLLDAAAGELEGVKKSIAQGIEGPESIDEYRKKQAERMQQQEQQQGGQNAPSTFAASNSPQNVVGDSSGEHFSTVEKYSGVPLASNAQSQRVHFDTGNGTHQYQPSPFVPTASAPFSAGPPFSVGASQRASPVHPFSQPPPFADFTPAPAHFFPETLPVLPSVMEFVPPFPEMKQLKEQAGSFVDQSGLIVLWMRIRKVTLYHRSNEPSRLLGGRGAGVEEVQAHLQDRLTVTGDVVAGVQELIASKRKQHAEAHRRDETSGPEGSYMVLHYHFFPDLIMGRTPALFAPLRGSDRPAWFHFSESAPRVFSRSAVAAFAHQSVPIEVYAYRKKPSWKDARDAATNKFVPSAPAQTILARTALSLASMAKLPTSFVYPPKGHPWIGAFLRAHVACSGVVPLFDPHNAIDVQIGEIEVVSGWGTANDAILMDKLESSAIQVQKLVRGFLWRRRLRRHKIAQALEEDERRELETGATEEEERAASPPASVQTGSQHLSIPLNLPSQHQQHHTPPPAAASHRSVGLSPFPSSPARSPRALPSGHVSPRVSHRDQALSPMPHSYHNQTHHESKQPLSFHLNLPSPSRRSSGQPSAREKGQQQHQQQTSASAGQTQSTTASTTSTSPPISQQHPIYSNPSFTEFVPAPRSEDRKDFVAYQYSLHRPSAGPTGGSKQSPIKSFAETLATIQRAREEAARAMEPKSRPPEPRCPSKILRVGSPKASPRAREEQKRQQQQDEDARQQRAQEEEESKEKSFEDSLGSPSRTHPTPPTRQHMSPPRSSPARKTPLKSSPGSARRSAVPSNAREELGLEQFSDVDVSDGEYDDDSDFAMEVSPVHVQPMMQSSLFSIIQQSSSLDTLDASVARRRLRQQMDELTEMQRRMEWKLTGRSMEEYEQLYHAQQQTHGAPSAAGSIHSTPARPQQLQQLQSPSEPRLSPISPLRPKDDQKDSAPLMAPPSAKAFLSPLKPAAVGGLPLSPMGLKVFDPLSNPSVENTPARPPAAASYGPITGTPSTPGGFLSPSPISTKHVSLAGGDSVSPVSNLSSSYSPLKASPSPRAPALPSVDAATGGSSARNNSSKDDLPPRSSPVLQSPSGSIPEVLSAPVPSPHQSEDEYIEEEISDADSDVSVDDSDDDQHVPDRSRWGMAVQANNVNVRVQYDAAGAGDSSVARSRLYPHGLHGAQDQPRPASSSGSQHIGSRPWNTPATYQPSEEDAARMARIARILAE